MSYIFAFLACIAFLAMLSFGLTGNANALYFGSATKSASAYTSGTVPVSNAASREKNWIRRIETYRNNGFSSGGLNTAFSYRVDDLDYKLMAADNASAKAWQRIQGKPEDDAVTGAWFAIKRGSDLSHQSFGNSEGTDGYTESAYMEIPRPEYYRSPEEVVWHRVRVDELRAKNILVDERMHLMDSERQAKWDAGGKAKGR